MFSDKHQEEIAEIIQQALRDGYSKEEVIVMLAEIIGYFASA